MSTANLTARSPPAQSSAPGTFDRLAVVYVRQSSVQQVPGEPRVHRASAAALADRAVAASWPGARDLASWSSMTTRARAAAPPKAGSGSNGFLAEVGLDHVGLILGIEMKPARALLQGLASTPRTLRHLPNAAGRSGRAGG